MNNVCLGGWTPPESPYPPYVSINYRDGMVDVTVRSRTDSAGQNTAFVKMSLDEWKELLSMFNENMAHVEV